MNLKTLEHVCSRLVYVFHWRNVGSKDRINEILLCASLAFELHLGRVLGQRIRKIVHAHRAPSLDARASLAARLVRFERGTARHVPFEKSGESTRAKQSNEAWFGFVRWDRPSAK